MIELRKIVSLEEFDMLRRDLTYSKVEVRPNRDKKLRNIAAHCYVMVNPNTILSICGKLKYYSQSKELPQKIKEKIGGFYGNFSNNNLWMTESDFKEMKKIEEEYKLNFSIPKEFNKYAATDNL